ncbi:MULTISPECIES: autotransporter outer membrane beta-barrel domain-containing protein [unclassified Sinorhizobium]|uniref:autotransporter outer membrane beta-barrel domain-containing protein n=1 Tax=unclassified Sinorhizobium TaxID=2613772 RepID=UPI0024C312E9|nr:MULTISPECIES: autotransporter outer membrane beta-barrel domain-containing protein [unclassified Sinorhizobium]MDK1376581.1 autotransporter outer membrane beta-barrel domain-containing protein [Sinorhizobium sp. 6-70]MDK1481221.1 autotransporter outer membrane beta-barrel domain-containing protein [Sinorhizobium sp. 6-117]
MFLSNRRCDYQEYLPLHVAFYQEKVILDGKSMWCLHRLKVKSSDRHQFLPMSRDASRGNVMHNRPTIALSCAYLLIGSAANAQSVTQQRHNFDTYTQAMRVLLGAGTGVCGFTVSTPDPDLTFLPNNPGGFTPKVGLIGPNLSRHCFPNTDTNIAGGSVIAGGISSLQSTRTVSQFDVTRRRSEPCDPSKNPDCKEIESDSETVSNYFYQGNLSGSAFSGILSDTNGVLNANVLVPGDGFAFFGQLEYDNLRQSSTRFEPARDIDIFTAEIGLQWNLSAESIIGVAGEYSGANGVSFGPESITIIGQPAFPGLKFTGNFENECGVPSEGKVETDDFRGSVFYQTTWMVNGFVTAEVGVNKGRINYRNSSCTINLDDTLTPPIRDQTAGIISGNPDVFGLSADINAGYDWDYNGTSFGPRISLNTSWNRIDEYSETESAGSLGFPITGTSLHYEEQHVTSLQTRIGFAVSRPFALAETTIIPFAQLDYIHEFENDQRRIEATFVEDRRPDPFDFSFKTNPPDRDFFELRSGVVAQISDGRAAYIDGRVILANDLIDEYGVTGGLRIRF